MSEWKRLWKLLSGGTSLAVLFTWSLWYLKLVYVIPTKSEQLALCFSNETSTVSTSFSRMDPSNTLRYVYGTFVLFASLALILLCEIEHNKIQINDTVLNKISVQADLYMVMFVIFITTIILQCLEKEVDECFCNFDDGTRERRETPRVLDVKTLVAVSFTLLHLVGHALRMYFLVYKFRKNLQNAADGNQPPAAIPPVPFGV